MICCTIIQCSNTKNLLFLVIGQPVGKMPPSAPGAPAAPPGTPAAPQSKSKSLWCLKYLSYL